MTTSAQPFDDIRNLLALMPQASSAALEAVRARDRELTKPAGSLGRLEEIVEWLACVQAKPMPAIDHPLVAVFAGNHGVAAKGVSSYPASVTKSMVANFSAGGAAINQICATYGLGLKVYELALEVPTIDITEDAAMEEAACAATFAFGMSMASGCEAPRDETGRQADRCLATPHPPSKTVGDDDVRHALRRYPQPSRRDAGGVVGCARRGQST